MRPARRSIFTLACGALIACAGAGRSTGAAGAAPNAQGSDAAGAQAAPVAGQAGAAGTGQSDAGAGDHAAGSGGTGKAGASGTPSAQAGRAAAEGGRGGGTAGRAAAGAAAGAAGLASCTVAPGSLLGELTDPIQAAEISPPNPPGITFLDTDGKPVNAHGGGVIKRCDTFYLHGEYFLGTSTDNNFNGFAMYSSKDLATWKNEGIILPRQPSGLLGPNRKGERPHIIECPSTGEFVLYAHAADTTYQADKEVVYATSNTINGTYSFNGALTNASGATAAHSDMSAFTDGKQAYVITESGWVYTLSNDCHSWLTAKQYGAVNGTTGGIEAPTVFKAADTYYWIGSDKTGWRANDNFYSTAPAITGPWTYRGYLAPSGKRTWMSQSTWVIEVAGSQGSTYVYWGDHWDGNQDTTAPGKHNDRATYVFQPLVFDALQISLPAYHARWKLDVGAGTWSN